MENFPVNPADVIIVVILLLSAAFAFLGGFVRESLGMAAWVGAAIATAYGFPHVQPYLREAINSPLVADAISAIGIFLVALAVLLLATHAITDRVRRSRLGAVDRSLGFVFGLLRGAIVVCLAYVAYIWAIAPDARPAWVEEARFMPWVKQGAEVIRDIVPPDLWQEGEESVQSLREKTQGETGGGPETGDEPAPSNGGYDERERRALEGLMETIE